MGRLDDTHGKVHPAKPWVPETLDDVLEYRMLQKGKIIIEGDLFANDWCWLQKRLDFIREQEPQLDQVELFINSNGGDAYTALAMFDSLRELSDAGFTVVGKVYGLAASAAIMILLQAADYRVAASRARFLLHELRRWVFLEERKASDAEDEIKEIRALSDVILTILCTRSGQPRAVLEKLIKRRESWLNAVDAKELGLIDSIQEFSIG